MTPMPPACAMAIAIAASVTVSIAEATIGMFSEISRVMRVRTSTSDGSTSDRPGFSSTSSKVSASRQDDHSMAKWPLPDSLAHQMAIRSPVRHIDATT